MKQRTQVPKAIDPARHGRRPAWFTRRCTALAVAAGLVLGACGSGESTTGVDLPASTASASTAAPPLSATVATTATPPTSATTGARPTTQTSAAGANPAPEEPTGGTTSSPVPDSTPASTGEGSSPGTSPTTSVLPEEPAGEVAEPTTSQAEATTTTTTQVPATTTTTQPQTTTTQAPTVVAISDDVPDYDMIDVHTGTTVNLRTVVKGDKPLLFWFWSPL